ncbi:MAG TPA: hypothetical protein PLM79_06935 [Syntrophobacteraceae bacterium]|nr:hypothetical protein [Syntrophobacteraceae bacterium]
MRFDDPGGGSATDLDYPVTPAVSLIEEWRIAFLPHLYPFVEHGGTKHASHFLKVSDRKLPICVEAGICSLERISTNGGKRGFPVEIDPEDLRRLPVVADASRPRQRGGG